MRDTVDNFRPTIKFGDVVDGMRTELKEVGLMQPLPRQKFELAIANEIELTRDVVQGQLQRNWKRLFPGVEYSETLMLEKLEATLLQWKEEAYRQFDELAKRDAKVQILRNVLTGKSYIYRRWDFRLLTVSVLTVPAVPFWFSQLLAASDWQLQLGLWGFLGNLGLMAFLGIKSFRNQRGT